MSQPFTTEDILGHIKHLKTGLDAKSENAATGQVIEHLNVHHARKIAQAIVEAAGQDAADLIAIEIAKGIPPEIHPLRLFTFLTNPNNTLYKVYRYIGIRGEGK